MPIVEPYTPSMSAPPSPDNVLLLTIYDDHPSVVDLSSSQPSYTHTHLSYTVMYSISASLQYSHSLTDVSVIHIFPSFSAPI